MAVRVKKAQAVLKFVRERGAVHPRLVNAHFAHGKIKNGFGGSTNATTHLLDEIHFRGLLRIARREADTRIYAVRCDVPPTPDATTDDARLGALAGG